MFIDDERFHSQWINARRSYNLERNDYEVLVPESLMFLYPGIETFDFTNGNRFEVDFKYMQQVPIHMRMKILFIRYYYQLMMCHIVYFNIRLHK
jgi:hypothetical protein